MELAIMDRETIQKLIDIERRAAREVQLERERRARLTVAELCAEEQALKGAHAA